MVIKLGMIGPKSDMEEIGLSGFSVIITLGL